MTTKLTEPNDEQAEDIKDDLLVAPNFPGGPKLKPRVPTRIGTQPIARAEREETWKTASDHAMVAIRIPLPIAQQIAIKGGERAADLHVTLVYLGDVAAIEPKKLDELRMGLKRVAHDTAPLTGRIQGYGRFNPTDDEDVIWVGYDSPDLPDLRHKVLQACRDAAIEPQGDHGFTPHITLAYVEPGEGEDSMPPDLDCPIKYLTLALGSQEIEIPLQGEEDDENEKPQPTISPDTFSTLQAPQRVSGRMLDLDQWAADKGDLLVRPDVMGVGCVVVKKGSDVHVAIENWGAPAYVGDLVNAMKRIPHDYIMVGRLCAYDVLTAEWLDGERMAQVLTAERVAEPIFFPADLIVLDGDVTDLPARERFERMRVLVPIAGSHVICPPQIEAGANRTLDRAVNAAAAWEPYGREETWTCPGVTVVVASSPYQHGVTDDETRLTIGVQKDFAFGAGPGAGTERPGDFHADEKDKPNFLFPTIKFDPDQPRDDQGQWTEAGGSMPGSKLTDEFKQAITNTVGAKVDKDGLTLQVSRFQDPEQAGERSVRTGVMFLPEEKSPWGKAYRGGNKMGYGGTMHVTGERQFKHPFFVKASTGGKAPEKAYDAIEGKGAYEKMRTEALTPPVMTTSLYGGQKGGPDHVKAVAAFLSKYGGTPDMAADIVEHSKTGNMLPYALQEHIVAHALRKAGYDSIVGMSKFKGQPRLAELFDLTMSHYPDSEEVSKGAWVWKDAAAGVFGTPGAAGILAPQQGMFGKPRRSRNVNSDESRTEKNDVGMDFYGASVPLAMIPTRQGKRPQNQDGETLDWPTYGRPGDTNYAAKYSDDQPRDDGGRWTAGSASWITPDGKDIPVRASEKTDDKSRWGTVAGWSKPETHVNVAEAHGLKMTEALDKGWVRATSSPGGGTAHVQFDGKNEDARRNAAAFVRNAFKGDEVAQVYIDRLEPGNMPGESFSSLGEAMRYVHQGAAGLMRKSVGSGDISGGGNGDGDSFGVGPGVVGAHTFRTGTLKDGMIVADPEHPRVNPYEAIFQRKGVRLGWTSLRKDQYDQAMALRALQDQETHARVNSTIVGATIMMYKDRLTDLGFTPLDIERFARGIGSNYTERSAEPGIQRGGDNGSIEQTLLNSPRLRKPERFPQVGEEMGFNDTYDALAKACEAHVSKAGSTGAGIVAIDFDGTCTINADGTENPKMRKLVEALTEKGTPVVIFTARPADEVEEWLMAHGWPEVQVTNEKSPDFTVMLDDRGVSFEPNMLNDIKGLTESLSNFKTWWEKSSGPRLPSVSRTVDMIEGNKVVVRHIFYGDDLSEAKHILQAHRQADQSLDAALDGRPYAGIEIHALVHVDKIGWTDEARAAAAESRHQNANYNPKGDTPGERAKTPDLQNDPPKGYVRLYRGISQARNAEANDDTHGLWFTSSYEEAVSYANWDIETTGELAPGAAITAVDVPFDDAVAFGRSGSRRGSSFDPSEITDPEGQGIEMIVDPDVAQKAALYEGDKAEAERGMPTGWLSKRGWTDEARAAALETRRRNAAAKAPNVTPKPSEPEPIGVEPSDTQAQAGAMDQVEQERAKLKQEYATRMRDVSGEVLIDTDGQAYSGAPHAKLANILGTGVSRAIEQGMVRGRVDGGTLSVELDWTNPKAAANASGLIQAHGKDANIYIDGPLDERKPTVAFRQPGAVGKAMRFLASGGKDHTEVEPLSSRLIHMAKSEAVIKTWNEEDHPRVDGGEHGGEFTSGGSAQVSVADAPAAPPKWKRSKHPLNEFGYTVTHNGRGHEIYWDQGSATWRSNTLNTASGPGASPVDFVGHNKADVNQYISEGRLADKEDKYVPQGGTGEAKKLIEAAGARWDGVQATPKSGPHAVFTEMSTGSTAMLPIEGITPEKIREKIDGIKDRFRKSETETAIKAAVAEIMPVMKGHDEIIAAVIAKLGKKPVRYRQIPVRDDVTKRILYVDNIPIPEDG